MQTIVGRQYGCSRKQHAQYNALTPLIGTSM